MARDGASVVSLLIGVIGPRDIGAAEERVISDAEHERDDRNNIEKMLAHNATATVEDTSQKTLWEMS